jgi:8-oxo-dGTP pyrophosphatase MutT (NUDIX family)
MPTLLYPGDATAAIILTPQEKYLMQQRDDKEGIFFPGCWGNFGGAIEAGETPELALRRELDEEIGLRIGRCEFFCRLIIDFGYAGIGDVVRWFYVVPLEAEEIDRIVVREGKRFGIFGGDEVLSMPNVVSYDATAIWQHVIRKRIGGRYVGERNATADRSRSIEDK